MSAWACSPYVPIVAYIAWNKWHPKPDMLITATTVTVFLIMLAICFLVFLKPQDGQAGFAIVVTPVLQWLVIGLAVLSLAIRTLIRRG
jgi:hypothetical protein